MMIIASESTTNELELFKTFPFPSHLLFEFYKHSFYFYSYPCWFDIFLLANNAVMSPVALECRVALTMFSRSFHNLLCFSALVLFELSVVLCICCFMVTFLLKQTERCQAGLEQFIYSRRVHHSDEALLLLLHIYTYCA